MKAAKNLRRVAFQKLHCDVLMYVTNVHTCIYTHHTSHPHTHVTHTHIQHTHINMHAHHTHINK